MIIYKDVFTQDELASDNYPIKDDGVVLEFSCKYVVRSAGEIVLAGANASAEGEDADDSEDLTVGCTFLFLSIDSLIIISAGRARFGPGAQPQSHRHDLRLRTGRRIQEVHQEVPRQTRQET